MALETYSDLKSAIADWLNRTDLTARIPDFIALTEASLNRDLRIQDMVATTTLTATAGTATVALGTDVIEVRSAVLQTDPRVVLPFMTVQHLDERFALASSGKPVAFTVVGNNLKLGPVPDSTYSIEVSYYEPITALSDAAPSNWVLESHADLYLYGSLVQASPFLGDDARVQTWAALYGRAFDNLDAADNRAQWSGPLTQFAQPGLP